MLEAKNGVSLLRAAKRDVTITSDASGSWGCGAFWQQKLFQCSWHTSLKIVNILEKELFPIVIAAAIWGKAWWACTVLCCCNNAAVVALINAGCCKHETAMHLVRCLFFFAAHFDFDIFACHIPGSLNVAADALITSLSCKGPRSRASTQLVQFFFSQGLAQSTQWSYNSGKNRFITFCQEANLTHFPAAKSTLCIFAAYIISSTRLKTPDDKRLPLSGLPLTNREKLFDPFNQQSLIKLELVLKGIKRYQAALGVKSHPYFPITPLILSYTR